MTSSYPKKKVPIYSAISNFAIAFFKLYVAVLSGSATMLSESIHSISSGINSVLLLTGRKMSQAPEDDDHPFGHGKELYFWSLIVALMIFGISASAIFFEALNRFARNDLTALRDVNLVFTVLGVAAALEIVGWQSTFREFSRYRAEKSGNQDLLESVKRSKEPMTFTILLEHTGSLAGIVVAFLFVYLSSVTGSPIYDTVGSMVIGTILAGISVLLIIESRALLIGESAMPHVLENIKRLVRHQDEIDSIGKIRTMHLGPEEVLLALTLAFKEGLRTEQLGAAVDRLQEEARRDHPEFKYIFIDCEGLIEKRQAAAIK